MRWIAEAATLRGDRSTNQDQLVVVDGAAAVLDGATSWLRPAEDPRDGGWYARMLGHELTGLLPGHGSPLTSLLAEAIARVRDTWSLEPGSSPYSTATLARWSDDEVEVAVLGDSPAVVRTRVGVETVCDERLAATAHEQRAAYAEHLRAGRGFDAGFAALIADVQRAERDSFNLAGGFWVAEADPRAAERALTRTWPATEIDALALMSDGAAAAVVEYAVTDWLGLLADASVLGLGRWLRELHARETADPDGRRWPRTKRHDDKTLVLLTAT